MSDYFQKGDRSTITNLLLYTENGNAWHTAICKYYKNIKKHGICNGRQIQIHEEGGDNSKAFLSVIYIYHNGTIMFQGNEACLSSVQANFSSLKALAERLDSHVGTKSAGVEPEEEEPILDCDTQLEQLVLRYEAVCPYKRWNWCNSENWCSHIQHPASVYSTWKTKLLISQENLKLALRR